jgi:hypothetical protein
MINAYAAFLLCQNPTPESNMKVEKVKSAARPLSAF